MDIHLSTTTLRDYIRILFRRKLILVAVIIPVLIVNYVMLEFKTPMYTGSVKMLLKGKKAVQAEYYEDVGFDTDAMIFSHGEVIKSKYVIERVVKALKLYELPPDRENKYASPLKRAWLEYMFEEEDNPLRARMNQQEVKIYRAIGMLKANTYVAPVPRTDIFSINYTDYDPALAIKIANAMSRPFVIFDLEQQIAELKLKYGDKHSTVRQLEAYISTIMETLDGRFTPEIEALGPATIKIIEQGQLLPLLREVKSKVYLFALLAGILLSLMLIAILEFFDQTIKSPNDVETAFHMPLLGSVPKRKPDVRLISDNKVDPDYIRAYKNLSDNIYHLLKSQKMKSILITDVDDSKDTPAIVANLGIYLSQNHGQQILIIDANLRAPAMAEIFNVTIDGNIVDVLEGTVSYEEAIIDVGSNLYVLPASIPLTAPITLLDSAKMPDLIKDLQDQFDMLLVSCTDMQNFNDAIILSPFMDSTVVVVHEGKTHQQVAKQLLQPLQQQANIIGAILNDRSYSIPKIIYKLT